MKSFLIVLVVFAAFLIITPIVNAWQLPVSQGQYFNWYKDSSGYDRTFYYNPNGYCPDNCPHIGEDINLSEGTPIRSIADGILEVYKADGSYPRGFGELYAVIEHDLGREYQFANANGVLVRVTKIRSIYGHIRKSQQRGGQSLTWQAGENGDFIPQGSIIGYVNDDAHNGDGAEHLHFGVLLDMSINSNLGYDTNDHRQAPYFAAPSVVISTLMVGQFPSGWYPGVSDAFLAAYNQNGGYAAIGTPNAKHGLVEVHQWAGETMQTFVQYQNPAHLEGALVYNVGRQQVYLVNGDFWSAYQRLKQLEITDVKQGITSGRYRIGTPTGNAYNAASCPPGTCRRQDFTDGYLSFNPANSYQVAAYTNRGGQFTWSFYGLSIAGISRTVTVPGTPAAPALETSVWYCTFWDQLSAAARTKYWSGLLYNGGNELCGSFGWKGYSSSRGDPRYYRCQQTDRTGCIFELEGRGSNVWDSHQTNDKSFPVNLVKGAVYRFSGWFRVRETPNNQRSVKVVLTPRKSYDFNGSITAVSDLLAEPLSFTATDTWQLVTHTFVAHRSNTMAALRIFSGGISGFLQLDDLKLEAVPDSDWPEDDLWPLVTTAGEEAAIFHPTLARSFWLSPPFWEAYQDLAGAPGDPSGELTEVGRCGTWDYCLEQPFDIGVLHWDPRTPSQVIWLVSGATRATLFPSSPVIPTHSYATPTVEFRGSGSAWQLKLYFGLSSDGRLIGFDYGSPNPDAVRRVVVTMDNRGEVANVPFSLNGVTVNLPAWAIGTPCSFYLQDGSNYPVKATMWRIENGDYANGYFIWGADYY